MTEEKRDHHVCGLCGSDICCTLPTTAEEHESGEVCTECGHRHAPVITTAPIVMIENVVCHFCGTDVCCDAVELVKQDVLCPECGADLKEAIVAAS